VTAVQRPAAQLAVALAQDLVLVHHQIAGENGGERSSSSTVDEPSLKQKISVPLPQLLLGF
jgi:hypothetical protein